MVDSGRTPGVVEVNTAVGAAAVRSTDWFVEGSATAMQVGVLTGSVEMGTSAATKRRETIPARWGARLEVGRDPVPPRVWSPAEFAAVIARTDAEVGDPRCVGGQSRTWLGSRGVREAGLAFTIAIGVLLFLTALGSEL